MNRTRLVALLAVAVFVVAVFVVAGCGRDVGRVTEPSPSQARVDRSVAPASIELDALTYEEIHGTLSPGQSGLMGRNLTTWDKNCFFGMIVPAESMPDLGQPLNFAIRVPTKACYLAHPELDQKLIMRFEPDGTQFLGPITIIGTWMPWQGAPPESLYFYSGADSGAAAVEYLPGTKRYRVTFTVNHFSDWEVGPDR